MDISSVKDEIAKQRLSEIPTEIQNKFQNIIESDEEALIAAKSDLNMEGYFEEKWLIVTGRRIFIFTVKEDEQEKQINYQSIPLNDIHKVSIKRYVGNAFLKAEINGQPRNILRFSMSYIQRFEWVASKIEQLINDPDQEKIKNANLEEMTRERLEYEDRCPVCGRNLPKGMKVCPKCVDKQKLFKRMFKYLKPYSKKAIAGLLLLWSLTALNLAPPIITRYMIDDVFPNANYDLFVMLVGILAGVYITRAIFEGIRTYIMQWLGQKVTMDLRSVVYAHIQKLSISYYNSTRTGKVMNRVTTDTARLRNFLVNGLQQMLNHIFIIIGISIILFSLDWKLALLALSPLPLIMGMTIIFAKRIHKIYHRIWRRVGNMKATLGDTIPGIKIVKAFTKENEEIDKFNYQLNEVFSEQIRATRARSLFRPAMALSTSIGAIIIWGYGGYNVLSTTGRLTIGTLVAFVSYMWRIYQPVTALAHLSGQYESAITSAERVFSILDIEPEADEYDRSNIRVDKDDLKGEIEFDHVSFTYEGEDEEVLTDINLKVEPGETIGLVGPTGAGKTTFVNLIPRFYDVSAGAIKLDDVDLRDYDLRWLRMQIGVVPQHPFLFYGTISENIAYGIEGATREAIIRAAKMANAHEFIMDFPMGYDSHVGERGIGLSGGERQRISIARAILKDAQIMILDEATSAVDTETESKIQQAIDRLIEGRTTFIIAHRLSTLKNADKLVVIEDGEIAEVGTHQELLDKEDGVFKKLWEMQTSTAKIQL